MRFTHLVAFFALGAACSGGSSPPPAAPAPTPVEQTMAAFEAIVDRACACPDLDCARTVISELEAIEEPSEWSEDQMARIKELAHRMDACVEGLAKPAG